MEMIPTAPACAQRLPALSRGLMVRSQRRGNLRRRAGDQDDNFALEIEPGKIVEISFRNAQAVADKNQRSFHFRGQIDARAEDGIFAQGQRLGLAVANQRGARFFFHQLPRFELHRLVEALYARGLKAGSLQLIDNVGFRLF